MWVRSMLKTITFIGMVGLTLGLLVGLSVKPRVQVVRAIETKGVANNANAGHVNTTTTPNVLRIAKVTAYSCGGLKTEEEIKMNCPSLKKYPKGRTATGTTPRPNITVACDRSNLGKSFKLEGVGVVKCEDTGGSIKGKNRFDLYVETVQEARNWGIKNISYEEIL